MKKYRIILIFLLIVAVSSCKENKGTINIDMNLIENADTDDSIFINTSISRIYFLNEKRIEEINISDEKFYTNFDNNRFSEYTNNLKGIQKQTFIDIKEKKEVLLN